MVKPRHVWSIVILGGIETRIANSDRGGQPHIPSPRREVVILIPVEI